MNTLRFVVPGPPVGKERARGERIVDEILRYLDREWKGWQVIEWLKANKSRLYKHHTPKKTRGYEKHVRSCAEAEMLVTRAKGWPTSAQVYCDLEIYHENAVRPDPSNVVKAIEDALTGLLWKDDKNVLGRPMVVRWPASEYSPIKDNNDRRIPCVCVKIHETDWNPNRRRTNGNVH